MNTKYRISESDYVSAAKLFSTLTSRQVIIYFLVALLLLALAIFGPIIIKAGAIGGIIGGLTVDLTIRYIVSILQKSNQRRTSWLQHTKI